MADLLIAAGADVELHVEVPPVEVAVLYQRREIFKLLIAAGARYDISHTLRLGMMAETRALLAADPAIANTETAHGLPLNLAVGKPGIFKLLLRHGADIHAEDSLGLTPLKAARIPESDKEVRTLLEMGVEDDIYGALAAGDEARVEAILKADPSQAHPVRCWPQRGPIPPVIWAVWSGSTRILGLILEQDVPLDIRPNPLNTAIGVRLRGDGSPAAGQGGRARVRGHLRLAGGLQVPAVPPPLTAESSAAPTCRSTRPCAAGTRPRRRCCSKPGRIRTARSPIGPGFDGPRWAAIGG